jgi:hypothetical protein
MRMPPVPLEYQERELVGEFFATVTLRQGRQYQLVLIRANGRAALTGASRCPATKQCRRAT